MSASFTPVAASDALDPGRRGELLATWVAVTDAGGSVGFAPPAPVDQIARTLDAHLARVAIGQDVLGVVADDEGGAVGMGLLVSRGVDLFAHWRTLLRLMVHPSLQGQGVGRVLLEGLHQMGRDLGLEHLQLTVRGGEGLEAFYERFGYRVTGMHPGAVLLGPDDRRDEIMMVATLD